MDQYFTVFFTKLDLKYYDKNPFWVWPTKARMGGTLYQNYKSNQIKVQIQYFLFYPSILSKTINGQERSLHLIYRCYKDLYLYKHSDLTIGLINLLKTLILANYFNHWFYQFILTSVTFLVCIYILAMLRTKVSKDPLPCPSPSFSPTLLPCPTSLPAY